jgi:hypothetical protein
MNRDTLIEAKKEAKRFLRLARVLLATKVSVYNPEDHTCEDVPWRSYGAPAQQGAVRRASLDLTRALARMRKPI